MSKGKGKEIATKPDWKDQLAMLDEELGWNEQAGSDWADSCEAENQEFTEHNHGAYSHANQDSNHAHYESFDSIEDDEVMSADIQKILWDAAVEEARSAAYVDTSTDALYDDDDDEELHTTPEQQEEQEEECIQPMSKLEAYIYHRFGPDLIYENRCSCHEYLCDAREEQNKSTREYFAQAGGSNLIKDPCILLPYPQDDIPGTEHVDKPVLIVTTAEGEVLYPHDMEEYPQPPPASWHGPRIGWGGAFPQGEHVVPYEDEDGADI